MIFGARAWLAAALALASCTPTRRAPSGFSPGDSWTIPLVGPLEDGLLLVPAWIDDKGPFLFALDPDANVSIVDTDAVKAAGARTGDGPDLLIDPIANKPEAERPATHPGVVVTVTREADAVPLDLEVLVAVTAADRKTPLKWLLVNMPAGTERTLAHLPADYVGATTLVLDASPFPRLCPAQGGCIDLLTPPTH